MWKCYSFCSGARICVWSNQYIEVFKRKVITFQIFPISDQPIWYLLTKSKVLHSVRFLISSKLLLLHFTCICPEKKQFSLATPFQHNLQNKTKHSTGPRYRKRERYRRIEKVKFLIAFRWLTVQHKSTAKKEKKSSHCFPSVCTYFILDLNDTSHRWIDGCRPS